MTAWAVIAGLTLGTVAIKLAGPLSARGRRPPDHVLRVIGLLTPAVLGAIIAVSTFGRGHHLAVDSTTGGVAVGVIAVALRLPTIVALVIAAGAAAALHALL